jgi:hypothetical protein
MSLFNKPPKRIAMRAQADDTMLDDDERGTYDKITSGELDQLGLKDGSKIAADVAPMFGPGGQLIGAAAEAVHSQAQSDERKEWYKKFANLDLDKAQAGSKGARKELERLDTNWVTRLTHVGLVAVAGIAGAMLGAATLSFLPFGGLIGGVLGSMAAGYAAEQVYKATVETHEQDGFKRSADDYVKQRQRKPVTSLEAAATLLANMDAQAQTKYEDKLEEATGTRNFAAALKTDKGKAALKKIMRDSNLQNKLHAHYGIPDDGMMPVEEKYAEMLNQGLDGRLIVMKREAIADFAHHREVAALQQHIAGDPIMVPQQLPPVTSRVLGKS